MSWWDKYLAPGDLCRQRQQAQPKPPLPPQHDPDKPVTLIPKPPPRIDASTRARRQNALLYGGATFTLLSLFITRRTMKRKYTSSTTPSPTDAKVDGSLEAIQALGYATLNVFSFALFGIGAAMTYFDVGDLEDMREGLRRAAGYEGDEHARADRELEGWVAEVLARRDGEGNLRSGIAEKVYELQREAERREKGG